jgi:hypothetical protein
LACPKNGEEPDQKKEPPPATEPREAQAEVIPISDVADPLAAVAPLLQQKGGHCAQIRSEDSREKADALAQQIEEKTGQPVVLLQADLGEKGVWWRICVGANPDPVALEADAKTWTGPGGILASYLVADPDPTAPRFFVKERPYGDAILPAEKQARVILGYKAQKPVFLASGNTPGNFRALITFTNQEGREDVRVVDVAGRVFRVPQSAPPHCDACRLYLTRSKVTRRRGLGVGAVYDRQPGAFFVEEETEDGVRWVSALRLVEGGSPAEADRLEKTVGFQLAVRSKSVVVQGETVAIQADGEGPEEFALIRNELDFYKDDLCDLKRRVEIHELARKEPRKLDPAYLKTLGVTEATGSGPIALAILKAMDELGATAQATEGCAAYLGAGRDAAISRHCLDRVDKLVGAGALIEAVNAAGALAESSPTMRVAVAGPLFKAARALDRSPLLSDQPRDCSRAPLIAKARMLDGKTLIEGARAKKADQQHLADLTDPLFLTAHRDFGPDTPVGEIVGGWLERMRISLPARHAAINAVFVQDAEKSAPPPTEPVGNPVGEESFGGGQGTEEPAAPVPSGGGQKVIAPQGPGPQGYGEGIRFQVEGDGADQKGTGAGGSP